MHAVKSQSVWKLTLSTVFYGLSTLSRDYDVEHQFVSLGVFSLANCKYISHLFTNLLSISKFVFNLVVLYSIKCTNYYAFAAT